MFLKQGDVRTVDEQIGAELEKMYLLVHTAPEVDARSDVGGPSFAQDRSRPTGKIQL